MSRFEVFSIEFANPVAISGQPIIGHVNLVLKEAIELSTIRMSIQGGAEVKFTHTTHPSTRDKKKHSHSTSTTHYYESAETYVNVESPVWGNPAAPQIIPVGYNKLDFQMVMPPNCPSGFVGAHGHISYVLTTILDQPGKLPMSINTALPVVELLDISSDPTLSSPVQSTDSKSFLFGSGKLNATVTLPRSGYVCGESIPLTVALDNTSSKDITRLDIALHQTIAYRARLRGMGDRSERTELSQKEVASISKPVHIPGKQSIILNDVSLLIPPTPPTVRGSNIINISYTLAFTIVPSGMTINL